MAQLLLEAAHLIRLRVSVRVRVRVKLSARSTPEAAHRVAPPYLGHRHLLVRRRLREARLRLRPCLLLLRALRHLGARVAQLGHELSGVALHLLLGCVELDHLDRQLRSLSLGGVPRFAQLHLLLAQHRARRRQLVACLQRLRLRHHHRPTTTATATRWLVGRAEQLGTDEALGLVAPPRTHVGQEAEGGERTLRRIGARADEGLRALREAEEKELVVPSHHDALDSRRADRVA
eukprot:scaffold31278_cov74-Phaeocystis_antarctica.AAC.8